MVKMRKKVAVEASPSSSSYPVVGEEARARFRYQTLMQDFEELLKETEEKKTGLQKMKQKKLMLLAEVKFLRKKYKRFSGSPSQETLYRLKKQPLRMPSPSIRIAQTPSLVIQNEVPLKDRNQRVKESTKRNMIPELDLNQSSFPSGEEMQEFPVEWEPLKMEKLKRCSMEGDSVVSDLNIPICRDGGSGSSRVGKRKIAWQDQVALRV